MWCRLSFFIRVGVGIVTNEELVAEYQNGNEKAFEELLNINKGIVGTMIKRWWNKVENGVLTRDELEAECTYAFLLSVMEYSPDRECTFASYAFNRINWWLMKNINKPIPKDSNGQSVSIVSISDVIPETDDATYADIIPDKDAETGMQVPIEKEYQKALKSELIYLLESVLTEREKTVILMFYGIDCKSQTQIQIASALNISRARVGQIQSDAIKKLQTSPLTEYFRKKHNQKKVSDCEKMRETKTAMAEIDEKSLSDAVKLFGL